MKISGGVKDQGVIIGNTFDKYGSQNPIVRNIMQGFENSLDAFIDKANPESIHEVGCGEGYLVMKCHRRGLRIRGSDYSETVINMARDNAVSQELPGTLFEVCSIYDVKPPEHTADLVLCCEVLEHLEDPEAALQAMSKITQRHAIFSVPREPLWSCLNMARGKYWKDFGNTPGHVQRWSGKKFVQLVSRYFDVIEVAQPVPWTMLLCKSKTQ